MSDDLQNNSVHPAHKNISMQITSKLSILWFELCLLMAEGDGRHARIGVREMWRRGEKAKWFFKSPTHAHNISKWIGYTDYVFLKGCNNAILIHVKHHSIPSNKPKLEPLQWLPADLLSVSICLSNPHLIPQRSKGQPLLAWPLAALTKLKHWLN